MVGALQGAYLGLKFKKEDDSMTEVKIYKITCTKGYQMAEQGEGFALTPWGNNTVDYEGYDDGGQMYILPEGYEVATGNDDQLHIYDKNGIYCPLSQKFGNPAIVDDDLIMLKRV